MLIQGLQEYYSRGVTILRIGSDGGLMVTASVLMINTLKYPWGTSFLLVYITLLNFLHIIIRLNPIGQLHRYVCSKRRIYFFEKKVDVDLLLDVKSISGRFDCICWYGLQTHNEQIESHSSLYIRGGELTLEFKKC